MAETRKLAAILAADVVGYSRLAGSDEDRTLARLRALWSDLIGPTIAVHHGRVVKRTGDGSIVEFRSVVDAVRCAIEVQNGMVERNAGLPPERRIEFRVGIHLGDVVEESDGDLMGDGVNIAARLEGIAKPGAICLSEDAYRQVKSRLDLTVSDLGPTELKNIAEPVRVYSLAVGLPAQAKPPTEAKPAASKKHSVLALVAVGIVALIVIVGGAWYFFGPTRPTAVSSNTPATRAEAAHLSIVVLPFANLSSDPSQDYFADGITENLTTELSRIRDSLVIARNTAFTYKGKSIDAKEIGRELGVRYVLEGSVQRDQNRVRVNAQLIDANTGTHLWADRFEESVVDLFKLQDQVVAQLANALGDELIKAEGEKASYSKKPGAVDLLMRGRALIYKFLQQPAKDTIIAARALCEEALKIDPNYAQALSSNASTYLIEHIYGWENSETDYDAKVLGQIDRALALAPQYAYAYMTKSYYLGMSRRFDDAVRAADAGLAINPNMAPLYAARAGAEISLGRFDQAKSDLRQAVRLSPRDPRMHSWQEELGDAELGAGRTQAAIEEYGKSFDSGDRSYFIYANLAAAYALVGKIDEAKSYLAEARRLNPKLTIKWYREHAEDIPARSEGLRKAGLPEDDAPHLSIVVLPFANLSGDPNQDYFADGITDNLTTDLSRIRNSFVIARNTAFAFKGKNIDVKEISKALDVRYILEGSVQRDQNRVRVNAQLIDGDTGAHLWADQFDTTRAELFQTQDEIVARLGDTLKWELFKVEAQKSSVVTNPDAEDLAMRCIAATSKAGYFGEEAEAGYRFCEQALDADPNNVDALALLAIKFYLPVILGRSTDPQAALKRADELASHALALDANYSPANVVKGDILRTERRFNDAIAAYERALALNPNNANAHGGLADTYRFLGQYENAIEFYDKAARLSPRDPLLFAWYCHKGDAYFGLQQYDQAIEWTRRSIAINPNYSPAHAYLAASLALTGHEAEARDAEQRRVAVSPIKSIAVLKARATPPSSADPRVRASWDRFIEGLRKAGMPEE